MAANNHPNRNWRARMHAACATFLDLYCRIHRWPTDGAALLTPEQMRELLRHGYEGGYQDGRDSRKPS